MSSDETDDETIQGVIKAVRRVRKAWLSEEVAEIWREVEAYHRSRSQGKSKRGNKPFARNPVPGANRQSYNRVKPGLPQNYYDPVWWQSIIDSDKLSMKPLPSRPLPDLNMYVQCNILPYLRRTNFIFIHKFEVAHELSPLFSITLA